ncbi:hypothetical protein ACFL6G_09120 [candidate division KSB1 bacterium]
MEKEIKVVNIISPYQIVLNCGSVDDIENGTRFLIYGLGKNIIDPDTKEPLETLEIVRGKGKVTHTQSKICTVDSIMYDEQPKTIKRQVNRGGLASITGFGIPTTEESEIVKKRLPFNEVQIGDRARELL